ncbi:MAG: hypothetical protein NXI32_31065, partial [bacterium]|nr:hypothetical protein [bacterium]
GLSIVHELDRIRGDLKLTDDNAKAISDLVQKRKSEIDFQLTAVWQRLSKSEPADDFIDSELMVLVAHETIEEANFIGMTEELLTPEQESILLNELSKNVAFANYLYCAKKFGLTPQQRSLFNDAARAIAPSAQNTREQTDRDFQLKFHAAMESLGREQFEQAAKAKGIIPAGKTLSEFYLEQEPERQMILSNNVKWFAEMRAELER